MPYDVFYFLSVAFTFFVILLRKRRVDFFTVVVVCCYAYTYPLAFGELYEPQVVGYIDIIPEVYIVYSVFLFLVGLAALHFDKTSFKKHSLDPLIEVYGSNVFFKKHYFVMLFIATSSVLLMFALNPNFLFESTSEKADVGQFGFAFPIYIWSTLILLSLGCFSGKGIYRIIPFLYLMLVLFAGIRSYFVLGLVVFFLSYFLSHGAVSLVRKTKYVVLGVGVFLSIILYKVVVKSIREQNVEKMGEQVLDLTQLLYRLSEGGESNLVLVNLVNSLSHASVNVENDYRSTFVFQFIPFGSTAVGDVFGFEVIRFSSYIMDVFYPDVTYGMGASLWGEMAFFGGLPVVFMSIIFIIFIVYFANYFLLYRRSIPFVFFVPFVSYLAFYFHRLELSFIMYVFGMVFVLYCLSLFLTQSIRLLKR